MLVVRIFLLKIHIFLVGKVFFARFVAISDRAGPKGWGPERAIVPPLPPEAKILFLGSSRTLENGQKRTKYASQVEYSYMVFPPFFAIFCPL